MKMGYRRPLFCAAVVAASTLLWAPSAVRAQQSAGIGLTIPNAAISTITDPAEALRVARQRVSVHDLPGAITALQRYVTNYPDEPQVVRFLGDLYFSAGDFSDATAIYRSLIRDFPLDQDNHFQFGRLYAVEGRVDEAIAQFNDTLPNASAVFFLVPLHQRKGDLPAFRAQIERYAADHPSSLAAQVDEAQLFGALYMPREAEAAFERALAIDPNSLVALEGLGMAQTSVDANASAAVSFGRCLKLDPKNYGCLIAAGFLDTQVGEYDAAQRLLERAYESAPEQPDAIFWLGRLADARGDWHKAVDYYEQSIYVWPYSPDPYVQLAFDDEEHGQHDAAQQTVLRGLGAADDARLHYLLGYMYRENGQRALALAQFLLAEQSLSPEVAQLAKQSADDLSRHRQ